VKRDAFASCHPIVNFVYFASVLAFAMLYMHPVLLAVSFISAAAYSVMLNGRRAVRFNLLYMLPLLIVMALVNPAFNHAGVTILFYLKSGNPVTQESIVYGAASAFMYVTVIVWFSCYNAVMTSDKFIYLFGRIMPALSLILSMVLRFVPRYRHQIGVISAAQRSVGRDVSQGGLLRRARNGLKILSIMTTWALENAIETADSMKSRGYGLKGRTSFSLYRFDLRDRALLAILAVLIAIVAAGGAAGFSAARYFPSIRLSPVTAFSAVMYAAYGVLCLLPVIIQAVEEIRWKFIVSRM